MITLKRITVIFLSQFLLRTYRNKNKAITKLKKLENEIPKCLLQNIENDILLREHTYYSETPLVVLHVACKIILTFLLVLIFLLIIWVV